jgi:hypothetical protein
MPTMLARQKVGLTMKLPLMICVQHSKAVRGDHDLNHVGDAIVIGLQVRLAVCARRMLSCSARGPGQNAQLHCR